MAKPTKEVKTYDIECMYAGMTQRKDGLTTLKFKFPASLVGDYIQIIGFQGMRIGLSAKYGEEDNERVKLGWAQYGGVTVNRENEATFKFEFMRVNMAGLAHIQDRVIHLLITPKAHYGADE